MKFRKKPVEIEAIQWTGENRIQICEFVGKDLHSVTPPHGFERENDVPDEAFRILIPTLEGLMTADRNDWIIKGVKGEFYPCKPEIFEMTYDPI